MAREENATPSLPAKVMTLRVTVGAKMTVGQVAEGWLSIIPITGGTFEGEGLRGRVCPGGADWNVMLTETRCHAMARYWLETEDGAVLAVENEGWLHTRDTGAVMHTTPRFLCDRNGPYASLAGGRFVGEVRGVAPDVVEVTVWRLE